MKKENLFIVGAPATGTSSLVAMVNCHPHIFVLFEHFLWQYRTLNKHSRLFLKEYRDARYLFYHTDNLGEQYDKLKEFFEKKGIHFKFVGDKIADINISLFDCLKGQKVIFISRDIKTWLVKDTILKGYVIANDVIPIVIDYTLFLIKSFYLQDVLHITMEDMIKNNRTVINRIAEFLKIESNPMENYWEKIALVNKPKNYLKWWDSHKSALKEPTTEDTEIKIREHSFWNELLPIFDKYHYYNKQITTDMISEDIEKLKLLRKYSPLPINDIYENFQTASCRYKKDISFKQKMAIKIIGKLQKYK